MYTYILNAYKGVTFVDKSQEISGDELEFLRNSISRIEDNIIVWNEAPEASVARLGVHKEKIAELTAGLDEYFFLIDVSKSARPRPDFIEALREYFREKLNARMQHVALNVGNNLLVQFAVKYMGRRMGFLSYTVHRSREAALAEIRRRKATSGSRSQQTS